MESIFNKIMNIKQSHQASTWTASLLFICLFYFIYLFACLFAHKGYFYISNIFFNIKFRGGGFPKEQLYFKN